MSDELSDFYDLLGVSASVSDDELKRAFRERVKEYHPDLNDDEKASDQFKVIKLAYETLRDPKERELYDQMGHTDYIKHRIQGLPGLEIDRLEQQEGQTEQRTSSPASREVNQPSTRHQPQNSHRGPERGDLSQESIDFILNGYSPTRPSFSPGIKYDAVIIIGVLLFLTGLMWFFRGISPQAFSSSSPVNLVRQYLTSSLLLESISPSVLTSYEFVSGSYFGGLNYLIGIIILPASFTLFAWKSDYSITWIFVLASITPMVDLLLAIGQSSPVPWSYLGTFTNTEFVSPLITAGPVVAILGWILMYMVVFVDNRKPIGSLLSNH